MRKNKVIVVTGASSKIGYELSLALGKAGHRLILHYHSNQEKINILSEELEKLGTEAKFFKADFTSSKELGNFIEFSKEAFGEIDCLINNASFWSNADKIKGNFDFLSETEDSWDKQQAINVKAPFFLIQGLATKLSSSKKGLVINFLDSSVDEPFLGRAGYSISKYCLAAVTTLAAKTFIGKIAVHGLLLPFVIPPKSLENNTKSWVGAERIVEKVLFLLENSAAELIIRI